MTIIPKRPAVASSQEPLSPNPFSPRKSKKKALAYPNSPDIQPLSFGVPVTPNRKRVFSSPSPDTFLSNEDNIVNGLILEEAEPAETQPANKARKRLRGEVVSPSPKRGDKRHRLIHPNTTAAVGHIDTFLRANSHEPIEDDAKEIEFLADSPVKPSRTGKHFRTLFEEDNIQERNHLQQLSLSLDKPMRAKSSSETSVTDGSIISKRSSTVDNDGYLVISSPRTIKKRAGSVDNATSVEIEETHDMLLPPSPTESIKDVHKKAGGLKAKKRQKVAKSNASDHNTSEESIDIPITELKANGRKRLISRSNDQDSESDPYERIDGHQLIDMPSFDEPEGDDASLCASLPQDLRTVLHISPSRTREREEYDLVESVLQGSRKRMQRGLVWGPGELDESFTDDEDEWAGEAVPWEVGEM